MAQRKVHTWTVDVDRAPADVFDYLADVARHSEWSPKAFRSEGLDGPLSVGSTFTTYGWIPGDKQHRNDVEVTELQPPSRLTLRCAETGGEHSINTFEVTPQGTGSRVSRTMDIAVPSGPLGVLFPVLFPLVAKPAVQKGMNMLKTRLEGGV